MAKSLVEIIADLKGSKFTVKLAKTLLREHRMTIKKTDGEYRVNFTGGKEASAYYTNDLGDAIRTALDMRRRHNDQN